MQASHCHHGGVVLSVDAFQIVFEALTISRMEQGEHEVCLPCDVGTGIERNLVRQEGERAQQFQRGVGFFSGQMPHGLCIADGWLCSGQWCKQLASLKKLAAAQAVPYGAEPTADVR